VDQPRATGLRERKKRDTRRALALAAQELVHAHGLDQVTVDEIAAEADVSVRTFFNYFSSKEEALVGIDPDVLVELSDELLARPTDESPREALRAVLLTDFDPDGSLRRWQLRNQLVDRYPALLPRHLAAMVDVEAGLASALAARAGVDPTTDPSPRILVAAVLAATRAALAWWEASDRCIPLTDLLEQAFTSIATDLPRTP